MYSKMYKVRLHAAVTYIYYRCRISGPYSWDNEFYESEEEGGAPCSTMFHYCPVHTWKREVSASQAPGVSQASGECVSGPWCVSGPGEYLKPW